MAGTHALLDWNDTRRPYERDAAITEVFERQVDASPEAVAVVDGDRRISYSELDRAANRVAHALLERGVEAEAPVGVAMGRSLETVAALLGILKAGGAYVPLDPDYPRERLALMLEDTGAKVTVAQPHMVASLPLSGAEVLSLDPELEAVAGQRDERPLPAAHGESLAYVMYTSGSTGRPKGVEVPHRGVLRLVRNTNYVDLGPDETVLQIGPLSFDPSSFELWGPLLNGGRLVVYPPGRPDPARIGELIAKHRVTAALLVSGLLHQVVDAGIEHLRGLRQLLTGGDVVSPTHAARVVRELPGCRLVNLYGPTETTLCATYHVVGELAPGERVPIGRPLANTTVHVLTDRLEPLPPGERGEIYIGGDGLARGYRGRPELTAERFVPDPFGHHPGARLYRTGDLGLIRDDGELEFLGRVDHQLKVRGYRVEPGEIEAHLSAHPVVAAAAVVPREDAPGHKRLVAYVTGRGNTRPTPAALRSFLEGRLPPYMIPSAFAVLSELPVTSTGKLDRNALPRPEELTNGGSRASAPPASALEREIADLWAELLRLDRVGRHDDFFELGGDSLLATVTLGRLREAHGVELELEQLFAAPSVAGLAEAVAEVDHGQGGPDLPPLPQDTAEGPAPLSPSQLPAWFFQRLEPGSVAYQFQAQLWLDGSLDERALRQALGELLHRHEILRTTFREIDGEPVQVVHDPPPLPLESVDLSALAGEEREAELERLRAATFRRPFDIGRLPLVRWVLVRLEPERHVLLHAEHHLIHDGWSFALWLRELAALYSAFSSGAPSPLPAPPLQFRRFARWQHALLETELAREQLDWWREELAGVEPLELHGDRPLPARRSLRGGALRETLPDSLVERLEELARQEGATLYMTMLAAFAEVLRRHSGQHDFAVGAGLANRRLPETEGMLGMTVNTVALRLDLEGRPSGRDLLGLARRTALGAYAHQDVPFERVVEAISPDRDPARLPIYQVLFSFHDSPHPDLRLPDLTIRVDGGLANGSAKADLNVVAVRQRGEPLTLVWEYSSDRFDRGSAERMLRHYRRLLEELVANPDAPIAELSLMDDAERAHVAALGRGAKPPYERDATVHALFAGRAGEAPERPALLREGGPALTYGELERSSNLLAHHLRELGAEAEARVGVHLTRGPEAVITLLAVLKAGAAYVPLDPAYPRDRLELMLRDCRARLLVTERGAGPAPAGAAEVLRLDELDLASGADEPPTARTGPTSLAYVMYTSGSTGAPKGVEVTHRAVVRLARTAEYVRLGSEETLLALAPIAFDASTFEIWGALLNGGRLAVVEEALPSLAQIGHAVRSHGVTTLWLTAGLFHEVVDRRPDILRDVRQVIAGGDVLSPARVARALADREPGQVLVNGYGPTEATTFSCAHVMRNGDAVPARVPIGRPIAHAHVLVLDELMNPVPVGVPGELYIGGDGLARGYRDAPALTLDRFVRGHYRTGDRVRWRPDGTLEFLGRVDRQLKLRGFRVEPGEVEEALRGQPAVEDALVLPVEGPGGPRLAAYLVPRGDPADPAAVRAELARRLPAYMLPSEWAVIDRVPLTPNGKVDRGALPPARPLARGGEGGGRPSKPTERRLADIWAEVLDLEEVGPHDDFFELGGNSLLAVAMFAEIERATGARLPLGSIFEAPTLARLSEVVDGNDRRDIHTPVVALQPGGERPPLFVVSAGDGNVVGFRDLARRLGPGQPVYGLQPYGLDGDSRLPASIGALADRYLSEIRRLRPHGPYLLAGRCMGAIVAHEMAVRLTADGDEVPLLVILDSDGPRLPNRHLANGWPLDDRMLCLRARELPEITTAELATPAGTEWFVRWLGEPVVTGEVEIPRYLHQAWLERVDLRAAYPDLAGGHGRWLVHWAWEHGRDELGLLEPLLPPPPPELPRPRRSGPIRRAGASAARGASAAGRGVWSLLDGASPRPLPGARRRLEARVEAAARRAIEGHVGRPFPGRVTLVRSDEYQRRGAFIRWSELAEGGVEACDVPAGHLALMREPAVGLVAACVAERIDSVVAV